MRILPTFLLFFLCSMTPAVFSAPRVVQSMSARFPQQGAVLIEAREEVDQNPKIVIRSSRTKKVLWEQTIAAKDADALKPRADQGASFNPFVRFQLIFAPCYKTPLIFIVVVAPGGSDYGFWTVIVGEVDGKFAALSPLLENNVQGGIYVGALPQPNACGLVRWNFLWEEGAHYDPHRYEIELYRWQGTHLIHQQRSESQRKYEGNGAAALRELGITVRDQRANIPKVKKYVE